MKKLILMLAMLIFASSAFADIGPVGRSVKGDATGTVQSGSVEKWYINIKNVTGGSRADGTVFVLDLTADDGYSATTSTTAGAMPLCVLSKPDGSACADDEYCRCQTWGLNAGVLFDSTNTTSTAGQYAYISENNAGYVQSTVVGSVAATDYPIGIFYDTLSASADAEIFLRLR